MILLVPADPLRPRRPDGHFAAEAEAAAASGITVATVDHDALSEANGALQAIVNVPPDSGQAIYRGWMLSSDHYSEFTKALAGKRTTLRTSAEQYRRAHELPGWYWPLASVTPRSAWTATDSREGFDCARAELGPGPAVVRDYVKSMKHYWDEAAFIPDLADAAAAWRVASRFRELRDDDFTGGFVLRRFERFTSAETRTWWVNGTCRLVTPHPDTPSNQPPEDLDLSPFASVIEALRLPFVTADLAEREDGTWRLVELGDGQVSDRPATTLPEAFLAAITTTTWAL